MSAAVVLSSNTRSAGVAYEVEAVPSARLRLTKRGRFVFGALATILTAAALAFVATLAAPQALAAGETGDAQQFHYVVVEPGASLWSVATELDASADPRDLVAEIVQLNQLGGSGVEAGQPIAVPLRYSDSPVAMSAQDLGFPL